MPVVPVAQLAAVLNSANSASSARLPSAFQMTEPETLGRVAVAIDEEPLTEPSPTRPAVAVVVIPPRAAQTRRPSWTIWPPGSPDSPGGIVLLVSFAASSRPRIRSARCGRTVGAIAAWDEVPREPDRSCEAAP
jgi:hypothetical protein